MRIRTVKPGYYTDQRILALSIPARLLFLSLLNQADDEGRLYDQPRMIGGLAFGDEDDVSVPQLLVELASGDHWRICRYEVDGERCLHIRNFEKHQVISRPTPSVIPPCPLHESSMSPHGVLNEASLPEVEVEVEVEVEGKGEEHKGANAPNPKSPNDMQTALLGRLHDLGGWEALTFGAVVQLNGRYTRPVVTMALQRAREENQAPNGSAYGLIESMCRDIAAKEVTA